MIKLSITILFVLSSYFALSQHLLKGHIIDKSTHEAIVGAIIYFPDLKSSSISKLDGTFQIKDLPHIKTLMQVKLLGYQTYLQQIDLTSTDSIVIELEDAHIEANEIVVTGISKATELKNNPVPMVIIGSQQLQESNATNIIEAMSKVPGVSMLNTGPNVSKPFIRGLGYNRILTLFDGVRQEGQQWGDEHGIEIDQYLIDKIEVVKGPASLAYGSDALAGVVNLLPVSHLPEGKVGGNILSNYQTNHQLYAFSAALNGNIKKLQFGIRATQKAATDYNNKQDGQVYNTGFNEKDLNIFLGTTRQWGYSQLNFSLYSNLQEIPDGSRDSATRQFTKQISEDDLYRPIVSKDELNSYKISNIHQKVQHFRIYSSNQFIIKQSKISIKLGYQKSSRQEFSHPLEPNISGLFLNMQTISYDAKFYLPEIKQLETSIGLNGFYQENDASKGTEFVIPNYSQFDIGPFLHLKKTFKKIEIAGGIRYDRRDFKQTALYTKPNSNTTFDEATIDTTGATKHFDNYTHSFMGWSGSIGFSYAFSKKTTLKANVSRGYRAPNISEIAAKGIHPGTGFQQLGDANFKPEFSLQEDVGLFFDNNHLSISAEGFCNTISNYIFNQKLKSLIVGDSMYSESGNNYPVYKFRQTTALLYGGELSIDVHPHPLDWLHVQNSISLLYAINKGGAGTVITDSNKYLPFIPPLHTNSELRAELKKIGKHVKNAFLKMGLQYYATQHRVFLMDNTETITPSYLLLDAGIGAEVCSEKGKTWFTASIVVNNLTDRVYQSNMSRLKYMDNYPLNSTGKSGIYNMGRNWSFKISIPFSN